MKRNSEAVVRETVFSKGVTDYIAINSPFVARVMRGGRYYRKQKKFRSTIGQLGTLHGLGWFMLRSLFWRIPGKRTNKDVLKFKQAGEIFIQTEGECIKLDSVKKIEVTKSKKPLKVIKF